MQGEFCRVLTQDRLELQGLLVSPENELSRKALIHIHGLAGNFYENRFIDHIANAATNQGYYFLTFNNRGHDYISDFIYRDGVSSNLGYKQIGGAFEIFKDCVYDISAWIDFLKSRGISEIIIQGHSHGALKATYFLANNNDPEIKGLILLSPSDDIGLQKADLGEKFDEVLSIANDMVSKNKGKGLMPSESYVYPISAATYVDSFSKNSPLGIFDKTNTGADMKAALKCIAQPVIVIVGTRNEAFLDGPNSFIDHIHYLFNHSTKFEGHIIKGAPHNYLGFETEVAQKIEEWLEMAK